MPDPTEMLLADLVHANHILYHQGVVDAFGHVSVRDPARPDRFRLSRSRAPVLVVREDLMDFDLDGTAEGTAASPIWNASSTAKSTAPGRM